MEELLYKEVYVVADPYESDLSNIYVITSYEALVECLRRFETMDKNYCGELYTGILLPATFIKRELHAFSDVFVIYGDTITQEEENIYSMYGEFFTDSTATSTAELTKTIQTKVQKDQLDIIQVFILVGTKEQDVTDITGLDSQEKAEVGLMVQDIKDTIDLVTGVQMAKDQDSVFSTELCVKKYIKVAHLMSNL